MNFFLPIDKNSIDIRATLFCGQVFRFREDNGVFTVISGDKICKIVQEENGYNFCSNDANYFKKYFDIDRNYDIIQKKVQDKGLVSSAVEFGAGIRILNQEPIEVIFSFIISANNHIPRIQSIIERLCESLGKDMGGYFAFPTLEELASKDERFFRELGAGYRANYLAESAKMLKDFDLVELSGLQTEKLRQKLETLKGVGRKVADCILLFAFHRTDVFPVDTWIRKVFRAEYGDIPADKLSKLLVERYGDNAGYVQQWLFYQKRTLAKLGVVNKE